ncbi:MAG: hypothetical protein V9G23_18365 [Giesbergeria sp.]
MESSVLLSQNKLTTQTLPFVVRMASQGDLDDVAALRSNAYGKHMPKLGATLREPEESDYELGCEVMVARFQDLRGSLLGTLRTRAECVQTPCLCKPPSGDRPSIEGSVWLRRPDCA